MPWACGVLVDLACHIDDFAADGDLFARLLFVPLVGERRKRCKSSRGGE